MKVNKLRKKLKETQQELYDLHLNEPSEVYYRKRREELEYDIAVLEDEIEFEKSMLAFPIALAVFVIVVIVLFTYAYAASPY